MNKSVFEAYEEIYDSMDNITTCIKPNDNAGLNIRRYATYAESKVFIDNVIEDGYLNTNNPSYLDLKMVFTTYFLSMFTDLSLPKTDDDKIDASRLYKVIRGLDIGGMFEKTNLYNTLFKEVEKQIEWINSHKKTIDDKTIENISAVGYLAQKGLDLINVYLTKADEAGGQQIGDGVKAVLNNLNVITQMTNPDNVANLPTETRMAIVPSKPSRATRRSKKTVKASE